MLFCLCLRTFTLKFRISPANKSASPISEIGEIFLEFSYLKIFNCLNETNVRLNIGILLSPGRETKCAKPVGVPFCGLAMIRYTYFFSLILRILPDL